MTFKIAVAQVPSIRGDIKANIETHIRAIEAAGKLEVAYLIFPELSLTGYEPDLAAKLAFTIDDERIEPLIDTAVQNQIFIVVGAPLSAKPLPHIGAIIITPTGDVSAYLKMNLHTSEDGFFTAGNDYMIMDVLDQRIANAICADTNVPDHVHACVQQGATIYAAGVLLTAECYALDTEIMKNYARKYNILVAMANHNQSTGGWMAFGKSAMWSSNGQLAASNETQDALVIAHNTSDGWVGEVVEL